MKFYFIIHRHRSIKILEIDWRKVFLWMMLMMVVIFYLGIFIGASEVDRRGANDYHYNKNKHS